MKIYLQPKSYQAETLVNALASIGLVNLFPVLMIETAQVEQAEIFTRLMNAIEQPFDVIYPPLLGIQAQSVIDYWQGLIEFHQLSSQPAAEIADVPGAPEMALGVDLAAPDAGDQNVTLLVRTCEHCGQAWNPKRKDSRFCLSPECQQAKQDEVKTRYGKKARIERMQAAQAEIDQAEAEGQTPAEADGAEAPELPADGNAKGEQPAPAASDPEQHQEQPELLVQPEHPRIWLLEDGPRKNERLTTPEMIHDLAKRNLKPGQGIHHYKAGGCKVIQFTHGRGLGLLREYGEGSPCAVNFSDPLYA